MGFISDIFGGGSAQQAPVQASAAQTKANKAAIAEMRRQFDLSREDILPFLEAGQAQLPVLEERATVGGLDEILAQIFGSEQFGALEAERGRAVEGQLAAGGLTRSGTALTEAARVPTDLGFQIEQMLTGRSGALAGQGQGAGGQIAQLGAGTSSGIANLLSASGAAQASGILGQQQAKASGGQNILNTAATVASIFFSDPSLKKNVEEISDYGDLKLYQWDWIDAAKDTMINKCATIGFMADEVKEKFPQFVYEFCGFMVIDYEPLLEELENV
jgi:hypothetical protein